MFIEKGKLPGNNTENDKQKLIYLFESIDNIIKNEELAGNYGTCTELASLYKAIDDQLSESKDE